MIHKSKIDLFYLAQMIDNVTVWTISFGAPTMNCFTIKRPLIAPDTRYERHGNTTTTVPLRGRERSGC